MTEFILEDDNGVSRTFDNRSEAEEAKEDMEALGADVTLKTRGSSSKADGGEVVQEVSGDIETAESEPEVPKNESETEVIPTASTELDEDTTDALAEKDESINNDPLAVLPSYMITNVEGKPTLNKRGVSVLAYHYNVSIEDHEVVLYPHEADYESSIVRITVTNSDGRRFVGCGEAHSDETSKHQLLRMAETRAYKRAVIFATGTGIVGYQELMSELEES